MIQLVMSLVTSRADYSNYVLAGLPVSTVVAHLQRVGYYSITHGLGRRSYVTFPALQQLYWLTVKSRLLLHFA